MMFFIFIAALIAIIGFTLSANQRDFYFMFAFAVFIALNIFFMIYELM